MPKHLSFPDNICRPTADSPPWSILSIGTALVYNWQTTWARPTSSLVCPEHGPVGKQWVDCSCVELREGKATVTILAAAKNRPVGPCSLTKCGPNWLSLVTPSSRMVDSISSRMTASISKVSTRRFLFRSSSHALSIACTTPSVPYVRAYKNGLPMPTPFAPRQSALTTSVPRRIPPRASGEVVFSAQSGMTFSVRTYHRCISRIWDPSQCPDRTC